MEITTTLREALEHCLIVKDTIIVPKTKSMELRNEVFGKLEAIGGKWEGNGGQVFKFKKDPTKNFAALFGKESTDITSVICKECEQPLIVGNLITLLDVPVDQRICTSCAGKSQNKAEKKNAQMESSPELMAIKLVSLAKIAQGERVCEPSAGTGEIVKAISKAHPGTKIMVYELLPVCERILRKIPNVAFIRNDFMDAHFPWERFDKIIASPPTRDYAYIYHIREMYNRLDIGGTIVTLSPGEFRTSKSYQCTAFRQWLEFVDGSITEIPAEDLADVGYTTPYVIIEIHK